MNINAHGKENYSYKINPELTGLEKVLSFDDGEIGGRLIIKFKNFDSHSTWFASFSPGKLIKSSSVAVISTPNPNIVCVFYSGKIYLINTLTTEKLSYKEQDVVDVIYDDINNVLLIFTFVGVSCFDGNEITWETGRLFLDGFKNYQILQGEIIIEGLLANGEERCKLVIVPAIGS